MKPIRLELAGLQSYREKQEVDFAKLCDAGVFGIFGPTGSGKSTILDAMTLALYGKVERAPGGTQGIMNQAENVLSVSFTFALTGAHGTDTYRVDRQFKRGGDVSVNNTISRIVKVGDDGEVVLADKVNEVNARVQEVLGLSMADFTRAVVLPQGKFAEFLSLKGVDRRQMLQRLFRLEPYGDLLNARLAARFKETDAAVKQIEAEQVGLGDASEAALEQARKRLNETAGEAKAHRILLKEAEKAAEEAARLQEWAAERETVEGGLAELALRSTLMDQTQEKLRQADQAARLQPYLKEWEATDRQRQEQAVQLNTAKLEHQQTLERQESASLVYEGAKQALDEQMAPLQLRIGKLQEALELEQDIADGERQELHIRSKLDQSSGDLALHTDSLKHEQGMLDKAVKLQVELKEKLARVEPKAEFRLAVQRALQDKQRADALQAQLLEQEREARSSRELADRDKARLASFAEQSEQARGELLMLYGSAEQAERQLKQLTKHSAQLLESVEQALSQMRKRQQYLDAGEAAVHLAGLLSAGEACPVCGSLHHPAPASEAAIGRTAGQENGLERLERIKQQAAEEAFSLRQLAHNAASLTASLREALGGGSFVEAAAASEAAELVPEDEEVVSAFEPDALKAMVGKLEEARLAVAAYIAQAERDFKRLNTELHDRSRATAEADARLRTLLAIEEGHAAKRKETEEDIRRIVGAWDAAHKGLSMVMVEAESERLAQADHEAEELRTRLAKSDPYLAEQQRKIIALQEQVQRLDRETVQANTELKGQVTLLEEKRRRLAVQLGSGKPDAPVRVLLEEAQHLEARLKRTEADSRSLLEQAHQLLQQAGNKLAAAEQGYASALASWERANVNWRQALPQSGFTGEAEVKAAILGEEQVKALEAELLSYNERKTRLRQRLEELQRLIGDRLINPSLWLEAQAALTSARERQEALIQQAAKAERDAEELEVKHVRWLELEQRRLTERQMRERLAQLQTVFRGNAFVEYIAEEQLTQVSRAASERLGLLTRQRYALEVDSSGGFVIRDDANGGVRRPVSTLSGGETFLTSLALALALSAQIQLNGRFPLEFFFLDEGFGTLDPDLLETVIAALERLHMERLTVGVISHVPELKARLPRKLVVTPAEPSGKGSRIVHETI